MATSPNDDSNPPHERYDVSGAVELLEPGKPLLLFDGLFTTDSGHLVMSQYVDIAPDKGSMRRFRPTTLVKAAEQRYALEFSPTIQISAPHRFRDAGESGVRDDQEGHATVKLPTLQSTRTYADQNLEQQEALQRLLGNPEISVGETVTRDRDADSRTLTFGQRGNVLQEGTQVTEQEVVVTSRTTSAAPDPGADLETIPAGRMTITRSTHRARAVDGTPYDTSTDTRTRVFMIGEQPEIHDLFNVEGADHPAELLAAVAKPFATVAQWPPTVAALLEGLATKTASLGPQAEVDAMSACWNAIWAVANLCAEFDDIIESVDVEESRFVAIFLRQSNTGVRGKILVGPRGTFAYLLSPARRWHHGGTTDRMILFPDDLTRSHFEEAGWTPLTTAETDRADD